MVNLGFFNQREGRVRPWLGWALNVKTAYLKQGCRAGLRRDQRRD